VSTDEKPTFRLVHEEGEWALYRDGVHSPRRYEVTDQHGLYFVLDMAAEFIRHRAGWVVENWDPTTLTANLGDNTGEPDWDFVAASIVIAGGGTT
jgi:hypothetical protein